LSLHIINPGYVTINLVCKINTKLFKYPIAFDHCPRADLIMPIMRVLDLTRRAHQSPRTIPPRKPKYTAPPFCPNVQRIRNHIEEVFTLPIEIKITSGSPLYGFKGLPRKYATIFAATIAAWRWALKSCFCSGRSTTSPTANISG